mmetsp:Transcript_5116/g.9291  ORF Transcript_5116/g.9291 Transcript_5116/m.9291 type:complete len:90 (-) Transcript_5116:289-558(-)
MYSVRQDVPDIIVDTSPSSLATTTALFWTAVLSGRGMPFEAFILSLHVLLVIFAVVLRLELNLSLGLASHHFAARRLLDLQNLPELLSE